MTRNGYREIYTDDGDDYVWAGRGADVLDGGEGSNAFEGGAGSDTYVIASGEALLQDTDGDNRLIWEDASVDLAAVAAGASGGLSVSLVEFAADGSDDSLTYGFQGSGNQYVTAQVRTITGQYVRLESAGAAVLVEGGLDAHFGDIVDSAGRRLSWEQLMAQALGNQGAPVHATGTHRWYGGGGDDELASDTAGYHFIGGKQYDDELHGGDGDEPFINGANDPEWRQTA